MRFYEIVILVHPDQTDQVPQMIERYRSMITSQGGKVDRVEDWGRRMLAYRINKVHRAHYILLNIQCDQAVLDELVNAFRFNDAVIRHLVLVVDEAYTEPSAFLKYKESGEGMREGGGRASSGGGYASAASHTAVSDDEGASAETA